ncbi:MAG: family 20 glycosylhydrolase, partial [Proteobacteria bacterium]|nr:family 20 glycosylhydrolase [Pseudomonadota bacterium]
CQARIKSEGLKDEDELQSYFVKRIEKFLNSKGKRLIGWDEILEGGLAPNATVQSWRGMDSAVTAATAGHDVIVSPRSHCYLDYPHVKDAKYPAWMGVTSLEYLIFTFPELLLVILAIVVMAGRYTGYRLLELRRFKALTGD